MNTKKLLAAFLSAAMILGTMVLPVFADETPVVSVKNGETTTEYSNINDAFSAVEDNAVVTYHTEQISLQYTNLPRKNNVTYTSDYVDGDTKGTLMKYGVGKYNINFTDITFDGLRFEKAAFGIYANADVSENLNLNIKNCTFNDAGGNCIFIAPKLSSLSVSDCTFNASSEAGGQYLIWTYNVKNVIVKQNTFNGNNAATGAVNLDTTTETATVSGNTITGFERGVQIALTSGDVTIENNEFKDIKVYTDSKKRTAPIFIHKNTDQDAVTVAVKNNKIKDSSTAVFGERGTDCISEFTGNTVNGADAGELNDNTATYVAKVGDKYFTTLADAIAAAKKDDTVTLLNNVTESITIATDKEITLDLNGKTLTNNEVANTITNEGSLTICDSSNDKTGKVMNAYTQKAVLFNAGGANAVLNGGTFERTETKTYYTIKNLGTMTINDGVTVNQLNESSSAVANGCQKQSEYTDSDIKLTINGGTFVRGLITIKNDECGILEINGGSFTNILGNYTVFNWNKAVINGGTFDAPYVVGNGKYNNNSIGDLDITNGTFKGIICPDKSGYPSDDISISGGTFSEDVSDYCADGYVASKNSDGTYSVFVPLAKIGDTSYPTLKDAFANVKDGETVTLLNNFTESIKANKNFTLDLNGYTLTNKEGENTIENYGVLTITDSSKDKTGKVDNVSHGKAALINYEGGKVTLSGGTFDRSKEAGTADKSNGNSYYTIKNYGAMTINDGVIVKNAGKFSSMIENGYYNSSKNFDGNKDYDGSPITAPDDNLLLTINGGTFTGGKYAVKNDEYGKIIINGGTFSEAYVAPLLNWNKTEITGGTFKKGEKGLVVYNGYGDAKTGIGDLKITGGNFEGTFKIYDEYGTPTTSISGGTFSEDVSDYCADGYVSSKNSDGTYSVLVQSKKRDDNTSGGGKVTPVYTNPTYTKDIFGVEHKTHVAYINGYEDGTVKPDGNITREELAAILYRVSNDTSSVVASGNKFTDVPADRWSAGAIEFMANKKVVNGYEDGSFKPANNLTRAEFAAMVARFADLTDTAASRTFSDVDSSYWGFKSIMALNKAGYVNGYEDGTFRPEANVTRAEVMTVINKIIGRSADASYVKSLDNNRFSDLNKDSWYYVDVIEATTDHNYKLNSSGVEIEWSK